MKTILFKPTVALVALMSISFITRGQSGVPYVLASAGATGAAPGGNTLDFTFGEPFVETIGNSIKFTEGFQQPNTSNNPLPISLLDFSGMAKDQFNLLSWHTAQEKNNNYFDVERSQDGIVFYNIGRVYSSAVNGNSSDKIAYVFSDKTMPSGINYYRLKQVNKDDQPTYSLIISLEQTGRKRPGFTVSPNPTGGKFYFSITSVSGQSVVQINDVGGKEIKRIKLSSLITEIDLSGLANGVYFIMYSDDQNSSWAKVIKE